MYVVKTLMIHSIPTAKVYYRISLVHVSSEVQYEKMVTSKFQLYMSCYIYYLFFVIELVVILHVNRSRSAIFAVICPANGSRFRFGQCSKIVFGQQLFCTL